MRQRLLLVAGWVAAAVVASLVSTGAVAVAGGQVNDRARSPLSASEVAALTEECGSTERAPCLRQLEDSVGPTTTVLAARTPLNPEGDEQGVSPPRADDAPPVSDDPAVEIDESLLKPVEPTDVPEPRAEVVELDGGRVGVSGADGVVTVIWLFPSPGFALLPPTGPEAEEGAVTLVFSDGSHRSRLVAKWSSEEGLVIEASEGGLDIGTS
ncbi:MAG: hypothetical protein U9N84_01870 [Actinomycetota bacterium]|nr:hypothetical protein [Actinomycetota bacterium]